MFSGVVIMFSSPKDLADKLLAARYVIDPEILPVIYLAVEMRRPLDVAELHLVGRVHRAHVDGKSHLEELV